MGDQRAAGLARAGDDVDHARRQVGLLADLGEGQRGQRRGLGGLEHHRVAAGQRGGNLPGQHQQREVPRDDLAGHAERPRRGTVAGVLQLVGPAGVVEEVRRDQRDVDVTRFPDRLAVVERLEHGQFAGSFLDDPGDAEQVLAALLGRQHGPGALVGLAGGGHRTVHVGRARLGHLGQDLLGGGRDGLERAAVRAGRELPVDEEPVGLTQGDDGPRFRRGGVLELGHLSPGWNKAGHPLPCGRSSATFLTCVFSSQHFSSYPASSRSDVPSLCPRWTADWSTTLGGGTSLEDRASSTRRDLPIHRCRSRASGDRWRP